MSAPTMAGAEDILHRRILVSAAIVILCGAAAGVTHSVAGKIPDPLPAATEPARPVGQAVEAAGIRAAVPMPGAAAAEPARAVPAARPVDVPAPASPDTFAGCGFTVPNGPSVLLPGAGPAGVPGASARVPVDAGSGRARSRAAARDAVASQPLRPVGPAQTARAPLPPQAGAASAAQQLSQPE